MSDLSVSFDQLIKKLDIVDDNKNGCKQLRSKYRPIIKSENSEKKKDLHTKLSAILSVMYKNHRDDIISKDFSFLSEKDDTFIIDEMNIGILYKNALGTNDDESLDELNNELLYMFYLITSDEDKKVIDNKYRKREAQPKEKPIPKVPLAQPDIAKKMEKILKQNKKKLANAENDPSVIPSVLADFFKNNSDDMAGVLSGMLGGLGINPASMK